jgi:hypothetical protein
MVAVTTSPKTFSNRWFVALDGSFNKRSFLGGIVAYVELQAAAFFTVP